MASPPSRRGVTLLKRLKSSLKNPPKASKPKLRMIKLHMLKMIGPRMIKMSLPPLSLVVWTLVAMTSLVTMIFLPLTTRGIFPVTLSSSAFSMAQRWPGVL